MKTLIECDYCQEQVDWTGMDDTTVPHEWRIIRVIDTSDRYGEPEEYRYTICGAHDSLTLYNIIATVMA